MPMPSIEVTYERLYDQAVKLLARRAHSRWELERKLLWKVGKEEAASEVVKRVCDRCQAQGWLNDADFAASRLRYRLESCGQGPLRVRAELLNLGVAADTVERVLAEGLTEIDTTALAVRALAKRFGGGAAAVTTLKERKKKYDFLVRRGFDHEDIGHVLGEMDWGEP